MSAIMSSRGASAKIIDWLTREEDYFRILLSQPIWNEYCTVADWLIPASQKGEKERILNILKHQSDWIIPKIKLNVCSDFSDNCFLECAVAGNADYLVTKNIKHFPIKDCELINLDISTFSNIDFQKLNRSTCSTYLIHVPKEYSSVKIVRIRDFLKALEKIAKL